MTILKSAPRIPGHPVDLEQFQNEWSHWTTGPGPEPRPWVVQDMFFAFSTRQRTEAHGPWHQAQPGEVQAQEFAHFGLGVFCHHCGWHGTEWDVIQAGPMYEYCPNCEVKLEEHE